MLPAFDHLPPIGPRATVILLGLTQVIGYGTIYYSFGILAPEMARSLGWSVSAVFAAYSALLLLGGAVAPWAGRRVDRLGAPRVMTAGSVVAAAALLLLATGPGAAGFLAGLAVAQVASAMVLYDSAFACIVQRNGASARRDITHLTLIAGFASTIFWPITSVLLEPLGWRGLLVLYAGLNLLVCAPAHAILAFAPRAAPEILDQDDPSPSTLDFKPLPAESQRAALILVAAGFALGGFLLSAILSQMVPLLQALGVGSASVAVAALFGPSQVAIRFANLALGEARHPMAAALLCHALLPAALAFLLLPGPAAVGAALFAMVLGCGSGLKSIVQGTLPLAMFGRTAYAERLGRMAAVRQVLAAIAPFALAFLLEHGGPGPALVAMAVTGVAGLACLAALARLARREGSV